MEIEQPKVGEALTQLSPKSQLRRKVRVTKIIAIAEAISYSLLAVFMFRKYILDDRSDANYLLLRVVAHAPDVAMEQEAVIVQQAPNAPAGSV